MMTRFDASTSLILVALEDELPQDAAPEWTIRYTGVGKVNAAIGGYQAIIETRPQTVINFGTAGTLKENLSGILEVTRFYQRDMDVRGLGFSLGQTPFENEGPIDLGRAGVSIGTGDSFVETMPELKTDLVDMEAYALARLCMTLGLPFWCFKYVSDQADGNAAEDWSAALRKSSALFTTTILNSRHA